MAYKTILTVVTDPKLETAVLDQAIQLATREDAHLDILCLGIDRTQTGYYYAGANAMLLQETLKKAQEDSAAIEKAVRARMAPETVRWSSEAAVAQIAGLSNLVAHRARFSDLVVVPKPYGEGKGIEDEATVEAALFDGRAPVLIIPPKTDADAMGQRVVVAWNESTEALAAVRAALPMLQAADVVNITVIDPPQHGPDRSDPGGLLSQMLGRHGVRAEIAVLAKTMPRISDVLNRHVQDIEADMVVMGAYGHSRFREAILGGATRSMLENAEVPVLMAH
ncbi:MAG: universal stress protein [Confluentimicrobium sp.]|mgnify:CR=1 FL=1|uniref:Nucleotide-binding universal stress UspA family protein n=1 Tax=Actibacterium naphthalenivorans TaxID=1614693 RepID=A0A840CGJ0_9RHOB|nr:MULTISPECIES: universal stress protein [Actibacterium]KGB81142.1 universal stress protein [Rhodovulum sp. NI22]MDY6858160.1 universal stress protein [Pseudomonadota bacterium]ALG91244.1 universal stress protein [Actibacterium sp. EMB200-NS6]MBB4022618.1 nucleotide-binding universal stress UspA family protein [Actibacterium naphthalenivorans]MBC58238.1 universal stress protein [Actibacterium sp.]